MYIIVSFCFNQGFWARLQSFLLYHLPRFPPVLSYFYSRSFGWGWWFMPFKNHTYTHKIFFFLQFWDLPPLSPLCTTCPSISMLFLTDSAILVALASYMYSEVGAFCLSFTKTLVWGLFGWVFVVAVVLLFAFGLIVLAFSLLLYTISGRGGKIVMKLPPYPSLSWKTSGEHNPMNAIMYIIVF